MRLGGITKGIDNYDVTPSLRTNSKMNGIL